VLETALETMQKGFREYSKQDHEQEMAREQERRKAQREEDERRSKEKKEIQEKQHQLLFKVATAFTPIKNGNDKPSPFIVKRGFHRLFDPNRTRAKFDVLNPDKEDFVKWINSPVGLQLRKNFVFLSLKISPILQDYKGDSWWTHDEMAQAAILIGLVAASKGHLIDYYPNSSGDNPPDRVFSTHFNAKVSNGHFLGGVKPMIQQAFLSVAFYHAFLSVAFYFLSKILFKALILATRGLSTRIPPIGGGGLALDFVEGSSLMMVSMRLFCARFFFSR